jgi:hypothetical protein
MPRARKDDEESREGYSEQKPPPRQTEPKLGNPDADPVKIHREYVERRLGGGVPATPEAYARALEQWHQLPGAVSTPPSEVRGAEAQSPPEEEDGTKVEDASPDEKGRP